MSKLKVLLVNISCMPHSVLPCQTLNLHYRITVVLVYCSLVIRFYVEYKVTFSLSINHVYIGGEGRMASMMPLKF